MFGFQTPISSDWFRYLSKIPVYMNGNEWQPQDNTPGVNDFVKPRMRWSCKHEPKPANKDQESEKNEERSG